MSVFHKDNKGAAPDASARKTAEEKYGFKGVLQKPYDVSEFSGAVKKALGEA